MKNKIHDLIEGLTPEAPEEPETPRWLERAATDRPSTKSAKARYERQARNLYTHHHAVSVPKPFGKEKFVRSGRYGAALARGGHVRSIMKGKIALVDKEGNVQVERVERPKKSYDLSGMKVAELRDLASRRGLKGLYTAKKAALIAAIERSRF